MADCKIADCRKVPSEMNCSLTISGTEEEVVRAAAEHAASVHGEKDGPELRQEIREMLEDEPLPMMSLYSSEEEIVTFPE